MLRNVYTLLVSLDILLARTVTYICTVVVVVRSPCSVRKIQQRKVISMLDGRCSVCSAL